MIKLIWNQVDEGLWQAGGLTHSFSIIKADDGSFSVREKIGDATSTRLGSYATLVRAQIAAQKKSTRAVVS